MRSPLNGSSGGPNLRFYRRPHRERHVHDVRQARFRLQPLDHAVCAPLSRNVAAGRAIRQPPVARDSYRLASEN
jgi:hypothetical protein